jgi:NADH dehydrogenase
LKTVEDALEMRRRILLAFELAEREAYLDKNIEPLTFVVVGGGPTGVELAGAIGDIARQALKNDFKVIDTTNSRVILFEGADRILGTYPPSLSASAKRQLESIGVEVRLNSFVTDIESGRVKVGNEWIDCDVVLWATGVAASPHGKQHGAATDKAGRVFVNPDLSLPNAKNVFVIGDMASLKMENGEPVPGVGGAAEQMGTRAAKNILADIAKKPRVNFSYWDKGTMATIGRSKAIADIRGWKFSVLIAWFMWLFLHIVLLIGFRNRMAVLVDWAWAYLTRERSARLITGDAEELRDALEFMQVRPESSIADVVSKPKASAAK